MQALIVRKDEKGNVWGADQKISRQQALWMKTRWAARYSSDEQITTNDRIKPSSRRVGLFP